MQCRLIQCLAGERLVIRVNPTQPSSDTQFARCSSNPGANAPKLQAYDVNGVRLGLSCDEDAVYTFVTAGSYVLNFEYPENGGGAFYAASLTGATPVQFLEVGDGSPTRPKKLSTQVGNAIDSKPFNGYRLRRGATRV